VASFNLRLSEILPGTEEDFGGVAQGGLQIDALRLAVCRLGEHVFKEA